MFSVQKRQDVTTAFYKQNHVNTCVTGSCADLEGGSGGSGPPLEFAKRNIADITGNEKISYFSYFALPLLYIKVGPPPGKNFWIRA